MKKNNSYIENFLFVLLIIISLSLLLYINHILINGFSILKFKISVDWTDCSLDGIVVNPSSIIPMPQNITFLSCDKVSVNSSWKIYVNLSDYNDNFTSYYLQNKIFDQTNIFLQIDNLSNLTSEMRIIVGNPNTDSIISQIALYNNISLDSILSGKGFNQGYVLLIKPEEIIIFSNSSQGGFYGVITLLWLMKQNESIINFPNIKISDWPDFKIRGFYGAGSYYNTSEDWIENLTMLKYNLWTHGIDRIEQNPSQYYVNKTLNREKFLKDRYFYTSVGIYPSSVTYYNYNLYEGAFAQNISLKFNSSGQAISNEQDIIINNSDFEIDLDDNGIPDFWYQSNNNSGTYWGLDCTTSVSGNCSAKLTLSYNLTGTNSSAYLITGNNSLTRYYPVKRNKIYQFSLWAKKNATNPTKPQTQVTFVLCDEYKTPIATSSVTFDESSGFESNNNTWQKYTNSFSTYNNESYFYIYSRAQSTDKLELWIDNVTLNEVNNKLINILETNDTTIHIFNEDRTIEYIRDVDFYINKSGSLDRDNPLNGTKTIITRISSGRIPPEAKISIDYDFLPKMQQWRYEYNSFSDPEVLKIYEEKVANSTLSLIKPDFVFIGQDEIRGFNRDSRAKKRELENYQTFAYFENNVSDIIHSYSPNTKILIWDDMFNPFHSGIDENSQTVYGGKTGKIWYALDIMDRSFIPIAWWYSSIDYLNKITNSPVIYNKYDFEFLGGPWSDNINIKWWSYLSYKYNALGIIDHEFYDNVTGVSPAANYSWNAIKIYTDQCNPNYAEICDGIDNDCDNLYWINSYTQKNWSSEIDEGFNLSSNAFNCGSCGNICYYPKGFSSCVNGTCQFDGCYPGYIFNNGNCFLNNSCGDGVCENSIGETCSICSQDCGQCNSIDSWNGEGSSRIKGSDQLNKTNNINESFSNPQITPQDETKNIEEPLAQYFFRFSEYLNWHLVYNIIVMIILIFIIIIIIVFFTILKNKKKNIKVYNNKREILLNQARNFVNDARTRKYSDLQIRKMFLDKGWDINTVDGLLK